MITYDEKTNSLALGGRFTYESLSTGNKFMLFQLNLQNPFVASMDFYKIADIDSAIGFVLSEKKYWFEIACVLKWVQKNFKRVKVDSWGDEENLDFYITIGIPTKQVLKFCEKYEIPYNLLDGHG